jgi:hypothetical protein
LVWIGGNRGKDKEKEAYGHLLLGDLAGGAKANGKRGGESAATEAPLLPSSALEGLEADARPAADVEGADALGAVELVAGDGEEVDVHGVDVDGDLADGLGGIGVEEDLALAAHAADLGEGLNDADLVVDGHDGDEDGLGAHGGLEIVEGDEAIALDGEVGDVEALLLHGAGRVEDAFVFL